MFESRHTHVGRKLFGQFFDRRHVHVVRRLGDRVPRPAASAHTAAVAVPPVRPRTHPYKFVPRRVACRRHHSRLIADRRFRSVNSTSGLLPFRVVRDATDLHHQFGHLRLPQKHTHARTSPMCFGVITLIIYEHMIYDFFKTWIIAIDPRGYAIGLHQHCAVR